MSGLTQRDFFTVVGEFGLRRYVLPPGSITDVTLRYT
jgi:hypothetical protein